MLFPTLPWILPPHLSGAAAHILKAAFHKPQSRLDPLFIALTIHQPAFLGPLVGRRLRVSPFSMWTFSSFLYGVSTLYCARRFPGKKLRALHRAGVGGGGLRGGGEGRRGSMGCSQSALLFPPPPSLPLSEAAGAFNSCNWLVLFCISESPTMNYFHNQKKAPNFFKFKISYLLTQ